MRKTASWIFAVKFSCGDILNLRKMALHLKTWEKISRSGPVPLASLAELGLLPNELPFMKIDVCAMQSPGVPNIPKQAFWRV
jgi:hypothetical protein